MEDYENRNNDNQYIEEYIDINKLKKNSDKPCKVSEITISKPGKHGHTKAMVVSYDILTNKRVQAIVSSKDRIPVPKVNKHIYQLLNIDENDNSLSVLDDKCNCIDYRMKCEDELRSRIIDEFNKKNNDLSIEILSCVGEYKITGIKVK